MTELEKRRAWAAGRINTQYLFGLSEYFRKTEDDSSNPLVRAGSSKIVCCIRNGVQSLLELVLPRYRRDKLYRQNQRNIEQIANSRGTVLYIRHGESLWLIDGTHYVLPTRGDSA